MKKLIALLVFLCAFVSTSNATQLTGKLQNPDGTGFSGTLYLSIAQQVGISSLGSCGGPVLVVPTAVVAITISNGNPVGNWPTVYGGDCTLPTSMPYNAVLKDQQGNTMFTTQWLITGPTQDVGTVYQGPAQVPPTAFNAIFGVGTPSVKNLNPCSAQSMYVQQDAVAGSNLWPCINNVFTQQLGGGGAGVAISSPVGGGATTATLYVNSLGELSQDIANYGYNDSTKTLLTKNLTVSNVINGSIAGNSATANQLLGTPAICPTGQVPQGVDAAANALNCTTQSGGGGGGTVSGQQGAIGTFTDTEGTIIGTSGTTTDIATKKQLNSYIDNGTFNAQRWGSIGTMIGNMTLGQYGEVSSNYVGGDTAGFAGPGITIHDTTIQGDAWWYHDPGTGISTDPGAAHCLSVERSPGNAGYNCRFTYPLILGAGTDIGEGENPFFGTNFILATSYARGGQTVGDVQMSVFGNNDHHIGYHYIDGFGTENFDPDQEGIQINPWHETQWPTILVGTVNSWTDSQHVKITPTYGVILNTTELIIDTVIDSGNLTVDNIRPFSGSPLSFGTDTTHAVTAAIGQFTTGTAQPTDFVNGTSVAMPVTVLQGTYPSSGSACMVDMSKGYFQETTYTASALVSGVQTLTMPIRYPFTEATFVFANSCRYAHFPVEKQVNSTGQIMSDPYYIILGAHDATHYDYTGAGSVVGSVAGGIDTPVIAPFSQPTDFQPSPTSRDSSGNVAIPFLLSATSLQTYRLGAALTAPLVAVNSCIDTSFNFSATTLSSQSYDPVNAIFHYATANTTAATTSGCIVTVSGNSAFEIKNGARVLDVTNHSPTINGNGTINTNTYVDGTYMLDRNIAFTTSNVGAAIIQPMASRLAVNNSGLYIQNTPSTSTGVSYASRINFGGIGAVCPACRAVEYSADYTKYTNAFLGYGGKVLPMNTSFVLELPATNMMGISAPMLNGTLFNVECPFPESAGGCSTKDTYNLFNFSFDQTVSRMTHNPGTADITYTGSIGGGQLNGGQFSLTPNGGDVINAYSVFCDDCGSRFSSHTLGDTTGFIDTANTLGGDVSARWGGTLQFGNIHSFSIDVAGMAGVHAFQITDSNTVILNAIKDTTVAANKYICTDSSSIYVGCTASSAITGTTAAIGGSALVAGQCLTGTATISGGTSGHPAYVGASDGSLTDGTFFMQGTTTDATTVTVKVCAVVATTPPTISYNVVTY